MDAYKFYLTDKNKTSVEKKNIKINTQIQKINLGISRLIDTYSDATITKEEFEPKIKILRQRLAIIKGQQKNLQHENNLQHKLEAAIMNLKHFGLNIKAQLKSSDWETKRMIINLLIKRVEIGKEKIGVVFKIAPPNSIKDTKTKNLPYCWGSTHNFYR